MTVDDGRTVEISSLVCTGTLARETEQWLFGGLIASLPKLRMAELFALRGDMFRDAHLITVATEKADGSAVGVLSSRWCALPSGRPFLHVLAQFVGDRYRRGVIFRRSWGDHFATLQRDKRGFPDLIVLKTYNPIVYCAMRAFTRVPGVSIYPDITAGVTQDPAAAQLASQVAEVVAAGHRFVPETGIIHGIGLPYDLYPGLPASSDRVANDYFAAVTQPDDRMLCMLSVPTPEAGDRILGAFDIAPFARS
jgi:hypothetical protein